MLKLKLQYFGHLIQRTDSLEKTLMLGKIEGCRASTEITSSKGPASMRNPEAACPPKDGQASDSSEGL